MKKIITNNIMKLLACLFISLTSPLLLINATASQIPKILILHSYHQGFQWTDTIQKGIESFLDEQNLDIELFVEYMDTKRFGPELLFPILKTQYENKYAQSTPQIIITSDDTALKFMLEYGEEIFPDSSIVFCGVNFVDKLHIKKKLQITGIAEDYDLSGTLDLGLDLFPETKHVAIIADATETGGINLDRFRSIATSYANGIEFIELAGLSAQNLAKELERLPQNTIILNLGLFRDNSDRIFSIPEGSEFIKKHTDKPVFSFWDFYLGTGILGGHLVSGDMQGREAAKKATAILSGAQASALPILRESPNEYMFDQQELSRFGLSSDALPAGSIVINQPQSVYRERLPWILGLLAFVGLESWLIVMLLISRARQQQVQSKLARSEERFRSLYENAPVGIFQSTPDGHYLSANAQLAQLYGFETPENLLHEVRSIPQQLYLIPQDRDNILKLLESQGEVNNLEICRRKRDGELIWVIFNARAVRDQMGHIEHLEGFVTDITDRRQMEQSLVEAIHRLSFHVDNSPLAVIEWEDGTKISKWSKQAEAMFGWSEAEVIGKSWDDFPIIYPEDEARTAKEIRRLFDGTDDFNLIKNRNLRKDGSVISCHWYNSPLRNEKGKMVSILSQVADVSELEEAMVELSKAQETAEAANKAKSDFLANMSHEIRTPLNGLQGMLQLLQTTALDEEQMEYIEIATKSGGRLISLLSDILDLSRVEAGKLVLTDENFDLRETLEGFVQLFSPAAKQKGLDLKLHIDPHVPSKACGDSVRLQQVLANLVGNAIKFTQKGHIAIDMYPLLSSQDDEVQLLFSVTDTGIGISDAELEMLFEPFVQVEGNFQRQFQGAGLGLAISRSLVALMGGNMALESEKGMGSSFYFSLPFKKVDEKSQALAQEVREGIAIALKILVVEDDPTSALVVSKFLTKEGHQTLVVEDGKQALERLKTDVFDLIFMDVQLPIFDGVETTKAIRNGDAGLSNKDIPIIGMTAFAMSGDREKFLNEGMDGYVPKPVRREQMQTVIREVLEEKLN